MGSPIVAHAFHPPYRPVTPLQGSYHIRYTKLDILAAGAWGALHNHSYPTCGVFPSRGLGRPLFVAHNPKDAIQGARHADSETAAGCLDGRGSGPPAGQVNPRSTTGLRNRPIWRPCWGRACGCRKCAPCGARTLTSPSGRSASTWARGRPSRRVDPDGGRSA